MYVCQGLARRAATISNPEAQMPHTPIRLPYTSPESDATDARTVHLSRLALISVLSCCFLERTIQTFEPHVGRDLYIQPPDITVSKRSPAQCPSASRGDAERTVVGSHMTMTGAPLSVVVLIFLATMAFAVGVDA